VRIFVAGHAGLVGSAVVRRLALTEEITTISRKVLDLRDGLAVRAFLAWKRPDAVVLAAARVGGIGGNIAAPAEFVADNLAIQHAVIDGAWRAGSVRRFVFLGSSCIYPREAAQPIREDALLTGPLEPSNRAYAVAKIAGIEMCRAYRGQYGFPAVALMPSNVYGPGDHYDDVGAHVVPMLLRRFHDAKVAGEDEVVVWGSGRPMREFLFVDDLADAIAFVLDHAASPEIVNVPGAEEVCIADLARRIADVVGFTGRIVFDPWKPDGTPRKALDGGRLAALGWTPKVGLAEGLTQTYEAFLCR